MNKTKKAFTLTAAILGVVIAGLYIIGGFYLFSARKYCSVNTMKDIFSTSEEIEFEETSTGYTFTMEGETYNLTFEQVDNIIDLAKKVLTFLSVYCLVFAAVELTISILIIVNLKKDIYKKGYVITLLVFSAIGGNLITLAFTIVSLCIKNKQPLNLDEEKVQDVMSRLEQ